MHDLLRQQIWGIMPSAMHQVCAEIMDARVPSVLQRTPTNDLNVVNGTAIIRVSGTLSKNHWRPESSYTAIRSAVEQALADDSVQRILLDVDSPGGGVDGVKELADWIRAIDDKPVVAYADGTMASAAYWIASACGTIYAPVMAHVGSIGVVMQHTDWSRWNESFGIDITYIHAGAYKVVGNPDSPLSESDAAVLQAQCETVYNYFINDVSESMGLDVAAAHDWAEGRVFYASDALALGMITCVVADRAELLEQLQESSTMNEQDLLAQHPDLYKQITEQAAEKASTEARASAMAEASAIVAAVAGQDVAVKVQQLVAAGVSGEQVAAMAAVLGTPSSDPTPQQQEAQTDTKMQILANLQQGSQPIPAAPTAAAQTPESQRNDVVARMKGIPKG